MVFQMVERYRLDGNSNGNMILDVLLRKNKLILKMWLDIGHKYLHTWKDILCFCFYLFFLSL